MIVVAYPLWRANALAGSPADEMAHIFVSRPRVAPHRALEVRISELCDVAEGQIIQDIGVRPAILAILNRGRFRIV